MWLLATLKHPLKLKILLGLTSSHATVWLVAYVVGKLKVKHVYYYKIIPVATEP